MKVGATNTGITKHQLKAWLHTVATTKMHAAGRFDEQDCAALAGEFDHFIALRDRVNLVVSKPITMFLRPVAQLAGNPLGN